MKKRALFIFRRDLRLHDNRGLLAALEAADEVLLCFIFTPEQIQNNPYRGERCLQFMIESLEDLDREIRKYHGKLYFFYGEAEQVVKQCIDTLDISSVFVNRDYTPYSMQRDQKIASVCADHSIVFQAEDDLLLHPIEETLKKDGSPYTVFTPFYRHTSRFPVAKPDPHRKQPRFYCQSIPATIKAAHLDQILRARLNQAKGGRTEALTILANLKGFSKYEDERNFPVLDHTTHLSAHLKFTTCSVREVYAAIVEQLGQESALLRSLYWRDFFTLIAYHFPYVFQGAFRSQYNDLKWNDDRAAFQRWCDGMTGFPIVDAGMRELNATGFMHNRVRMIAASFLIKDLHIHWQWGERYFAQHLIDYDPAVNNGNWQWAASTGCDAQPYFRIFNPWSQAKKFDPEGRYIKKWIPELDTHYVKPMVEHSHEAKIALAAYKKLRSR